MNSQNLKKKNIQVTKHNKIINSKMQKKHVRSHLGFTGNDFDTVQKD